MQALTHVMPEGYLPSVVLQNLARVAVVGAMVRKSYRVKGSGKACRSVGECVDRCRRWLFDLCLVLRI